MNPLSVLAIAFAMSTDAFAAAIAKGAALQRPSWREALRTGAIFGVIEAITPLVGWLIGSAAAKYASEWDHWIAFTLLAGLGARMVWAGLRSNDSDVDERPATHSFWVLALTGLATSIDALAVGVGLAFVDVHIGWVAVAIGTATFVMVAFGLMLGRVLGAVAGKRAEILGGLLLIGIGTAIVFEHLGAAPQ
jgi:putative Mn2+ efflux pump MntP